MIIDSIRGVAASGQDQAAEASIPHKRLLIALAYVALSVAALWPVFATSSPPLIDLPNHLARLHILENIADDPVLQANYRAERSVMPNLAMEIVVGPLVRLLGVWSAGRLFVAMTMLVLIIGTVTLHRVLHGRIGLWPAAVFLILYNHALVWGLVGFLFTLGMALCGFAGWIFLREKPMWRRLMLFTGLATGLFFMHLLGLAVYGLLVGAYELKRGLARPRDMRRVWRDWAVTGATFAPALVLLAISAARAPGEFMVDYGGLGLKLRAILAPTLTYMETLDGILLIFLGGALLFGLLTRRIGVYRGMGLPLIVLAGLVVAIPAWMNGSFGAAWGMDMRLSIALAFVAIATLDFRMRSRRVALVLGAVGLVLFAARAVTITESWTGYDRQFTEFREAASAIEPGAAIFQVQSDRANPDIRNGRLPQVYWHMVTQAVVTSGAFVPTLFTDPAKQPVLPSASREAIDTPYGAPVETSELMAWTDPARFERLGPLIDESGMRHYQAMWQDNFDYVVVLHQGSQTNPAPEYLNPFAAGSFFDIYRVKRGGAAESPAQ